MFVLRVLARQSEGRLRPASRLKPKSPSLSVERLESRQLLHGGGSHTHALEPIPPRAPAAELQTIPSVVARPRREPVQAIIRRLDAELEAQLSAGPVADHDAGRIDDEGYIAAITDLVERFKQHVDQQLLPARARAAARYKDQLDRQLDLLVDFIRQHDESRLALHIHPHLTILINGRPLTIPANIGITAKSTGPVHTHDTSGTIHVESEEVRTFYLKDFFAAWGRTFTPRNLLGRRADAAHKITMTVNGQPNTEYGDLVLRDHDEIVISYGPKRPRFGGG